MYAQKHYHFDTCRRCKTCLRVKLLWMFPKGRGRQGIEPSCKKCKRAYQVEYLKRPGVAERYKTINKARYEANKPTIMKQQLARHHHRKDEPGRKTASRIRSGIYSALRGTRKSKPTFILLGYSALELAAHLERQFASRMDWTNANEWHIDHIVPVSAFIEQFGNTEEAIKKAWALTNLRPIWARDNLQKHAKRTHLI